MKLSLIKSDSVPLSEKAAEEIIKFIQKNQMQKGDRMPNEKKLMEQLNVSRSTIREAMRSLSSRGIVVIRQGSGTYISNYPGVSEDPLGLSFQYDKEKVVMDLLELRLIMEPSIAAFCARRATKKDADEIMALAKQITALIRKGKDHTDIDVAFHCKIAEATGNDVLNVVFPEVIKGIRLFSSMLGDRIVHDVGEDHERVAEAIVKRDTQRAATAMTMHLERNRYAIEEYLEQHNTKQAKKANAEGRSGSIE